jgi:hypothetical protein
MYPHLALLFALTFRMGGAFPNRILHLFPNFRILLHKPGLAPVFIPVVGMHHAGITGRNGTPSGTRKKCHQRQQQQNSAQPHEANRFSSKHVSRIFNMQIA